MTQHSYIVTTYNHLSEQSYVFGPFATIYDAEQFKQGLNRQTWAHPKFDVLNSPHDVDTDEQQALPEW